MNFRRKKYSLRLFVFTFSTISFNSHSEVVLDGTLGASGAIDGPEYTISAEVGQQEGGNLFHSFSQFNINTDESAMFTGPDSVNNIIGRVTGGEGSFIDGGLDSDIPGVNLFLVNPSGIMFGPNAWLGVDGSFQATTADYLKLGEDGRFDASQPSNSILTTAEPSAFGFVGSDTADINVSGSGLYLEENKTLSLVGGDINLDNSAYLFAPSGRVNLASVKSPGEVVPTEDNLEVASFDSLGNITIKPGFVDTRGDPGGSVYIRGGNFVIDQVSLDFSNAYNYMGISSASNGEIDHPGVGIDIDITGDFSIRGAELSTSSSGSGAGGDIKIHANSVNMLGGDRSEDVAWGIASYIAARVWSSGDGGNITIDANNISMEDHNYVTTQVYGSGKGGDVTINSENIDISTGIAPFTGGAFISSSSLGEGDAGDLTINSNNIKLVRGPSYVVIGSQAQDTGAAGNTQIHTDKLELINGAQIVSNVFGDAHAAGDTDITAKNIIISGRAENGIFAPSGIFANVQDTEIEVDGGNISLNTESLQITDGGEIGASNLSKGKAGNINIVAEDISLTSTETLLSAGSGADANGGGEITIQTKKLELLEGAQIRTNTQGPGDAGPININADNIIISGIGEDDAPSNIMSNTNGEATGNANTITLAVTNKLTLDDRAALIVSSETDGNGGSVNVTASEITLLGGSYITANTTGAGNGGDIHLTSDQITISGVHDEPYDHPLTDGETLYQSSVVSQTGLNEGNAGNITINTKQLEVLDGAGISVETFGPGNAGSIEINADRTLVSGNNANALAYFLNKGETSEVAQNIASSSIKSGTNIDFIEISETGAGGSIVLNSNEVEISQLGIIASSTESSADGGSLIINGNDIKLLENGNISASSTANGEAGNIEINASTLQSSNSTIETSASSADGGNINLNVSDLVLLDNTIITAEVGSADGTGGNITLSSESELVVFDKAVVTANAVDGPGGNVSISAQNIITTPDSEITASSISNVDGEITIDAPEVDLSGSLTPLTDRAVKTAVVLRKPCKERSQADSIHLVQQHYRILPNSPESLSNPLVDLDSEKSNNIEAAMNNSDSKYFVNPPVVLCRGDEQKTQRKKS